MRGLITALIFIFASALCEAGTFAYISNANVPSYISACGIDTLTGQFTNCDQLFIENLSAPLDIAIAQINDSHYAYISNNTYPAMIMKCQVVNGELHPCITTDIPSYTGIAVHQSDHLYLYLSQSASIQKCKIQSNGDMHRDDCSDSGAGEIFSNGPIYKKFQYLNHKPYVYIANGDYRYNANIILCVVLENGNLSDCIDSGAGYFDGTADIDFLTLNAQTYAYITHSGGGLSKCNVNTFNGLLSACSLTDNYFHSPLGLAIMQRAADYYMYVVDGGFRSPVENTVSICKINISGDPACADSGLGTAFSNPFGIALIK